MAEEPKKKTRDEILAEYAANPAEGLDSKGIQERIAGYTGLHGQDYTVMVPDTARLSAEILNDTLARANKVGITLNPGAVQQAAQYAAANMIGGTFNPQAYAELISNIGGGVNSQQFETLKQISNEVGTVYLPLAPGYKSPQVTKNDFSQELKSLNALLGTKQTQEKNELQQKAQQEQGAMDRQKSDALFQQALQALTNPTNASAYSPELTQQALDQIQQKILGQGQTALANVEAGAARRGITGSTIEGFQMAETEGRITDSLASATLDFLLRAGEKGQQYRETIAQTLMNQAGALLGAGQQTQALATNSGLQTQGMDLQRQQLAMQVEQFNRTFQESQKQFTQNLAFQQQQAMDNLGLLLQQLNKKKPSNLGANLLSGGIGGAATGATVGGPWGAVVGGGLGLALGGLGSSV